MLLNKKKKKKQALRIKKFILQTQCNQKHNPLFHQISCTSILYFVMFSIALSFSNFTVSHISINSQESPQQKGDNI